MLSANFILNTTCFDRKRSSSGDVQKPVKYNGTAVIRTHVNPKLFRVPQRKSAPLEITNVISLLYLLAAELNSREICLSVSGERCNPVTRFMTTLK
jgi:hypothetical protein